MEEITPLTAVSPRPLMTASLRLCTWNIEFGLQLDAIVSAVKSCADFAGIDMLALQEASIHDGVEDGRVIAQALGSQYEYYQMTAQRVNGRVQANALIWNVDRVQVDTRGSVKLPQRHEVKLSHAERLFLRAIPLQHRISVVVEARVATGGGLPHPRASHLRQLAPRRQAPRLPHPGAGHLRQPAPWRENSCASMWRIST